MKATINCPLNIGDEVWFIDEGHPRKGIILKLYFEMSANDGEPKLVNSKCKYYENEILHICEPDKVFKSEKSLRDYHRMEALGWIL